jgi:uncharacterized integral membrane protein
MREFIRANQEYLRLIAQIDVTTKELQGRQIDTALQFEGLYLEAKKKAINSLYGVLYGTVVILILLLFLYRNLGNVFIDLFFGFCVVIILLLAWNATISAKRAKATKSAWDKEFSIDEELTKKTKQLKHQAASIAFNIITFSEHYDELMGIPSLDDRKRLFNIYLKETIDGFDLINGLHSTYEDYLAYYLAWQAKHEG